MKQFRLLYSFAAALATLVIVVEGDNYMFDEKCTVEMISFIQSAFVNAQAMATAAYGAIQGEHSPAIKSVLDNLFDPTVNPSLGVIYGAEVFGQRGPNRFDNTVDDNAKLEDDHLKIYCDTSRIKFDAKKNVYFDNDVGQEVSADSCVSLTGGKNLMYTRLLQWNTDPTRTQHRWWQIQVCPLFLSYAMPATYKFTTALLSGQFYSKVVANPIAELVAATKFTPIDAASLFDKVMLHELTHASLNYHTYDVAGSKDSYGWKNCKKLSTVRSQNPGVASSDTPMGPELNADTWALFGSIAWQIANNKITGVNDDGTFNAV